MIMQCDAMSTAMEEESGFELQNHHGLLSGLGRTGDSFVLDFALMEV